MNLTPETLIQLAVGLALFAFGWTLFRFGIRAVGFGLGFMAGYSTYKLLLEWIPKISADSIKYFPQTEFAPILLGVVLGLVGMYVAKKMYMVTVFVGSFAGGLYLLYAQDQYREMIAGVLNRLGVLEAINSTIGPIWPALVALLIAGLFVVMQRQLMTLLTACVGSYIIVETVKIPVLFLPLCFIGFLLQQTQTRYKRKKKPRVEEEVEG